MVLPQTDPAAAFAIAERIRRSIAGHTFLKGGRSPDPADGKLRDRGVSRPREIEGRPDSPGRRSHVPSEARSSGQRVHRGARLGPDPGGFNGSVQLCHEGDHSQSRLLRAGIVRQDDQPSEYPSETQPQTRGKLISLATETDRTLFFDFLPMELGMIRGFRVRFQLYTVPGQVYYNATRKLVLKGADGVIFVADSQKEMMERNVESFQNLKENLRINSLDPDTIPLVVQYNKRDLDNLSSSKNWKRGSTPAGSLSSRRWRRPDGA